MAHLVGIITFSWQKEKVPPTKLAPVLLDQAILGIVESDVIDSFLKYVSFTDFEGVNKEELMES